MAEAVKLYQELGFPALQRGGQDRKLVGYFQSDTGTINQLVHLWKFDDDSDRRAHWASVYTNKDFVEGFVAKFRPLLMTQEVKLLHAAPDILLQYSLHAPRRGRDDVRNFMVGFPAAFPDLNFWGAADLIAEGDYVVGAGKAAALTPDPPSAIFLWA